jgi:simple sugar transport system ATP-binding protein
MERIKEIELKNITKKFPGVLANNNITVNFKSGEIHTLLGENGAGKTTVMRILYGMYQPDSGEIIINNKKVKISSPKEGIDLGIGMVHQHFMLVPSFTVLENIILNYPSTKEPFIDIKSARKRIREMSEKYGLRINPDAKVWQLSVGEQQRVEILKILFRDASFIILDEPTAVLTPQEVEDLFRTLMELKKTRGIVFISHKLKEVLKISDRITVLRNGSVVGETDPSKTTLSQLAKMMIGREIMNQWMKEKVENKRTILKIENLNIKNDKDLPAVKNLSIEIREGEILGIAGVSGNGQKELEEIMAGLRKATSGKILLEGNNIINKLPKEIIKLGVSYIPEERMSTGIIEDFTIVENLILKNHGTNPFSKWIFLQNRIINKNAKKLTKEFDVKTPSITTPVRNLSGGNIQKLILARELSGTPKLLVACQPTRGLDVGATEYIHKRIVEIANKGTAVLLISEDLDEIIELSDRIAVIYEGEIAGIVLPTTSIEKIGLMMTGALRDTISTF